MKLKRTAWLIIGIGIFVIAAASLYVLYNNQVEKRQAAKDALAEAEVTLQDLYLEKITFEGDLEDVQAELEQWEIELAQWQEKLAQAQDESGQAQEGFLASIDDIEYQELLFALAYDSGVEIEGLRSTGLGNEAIEGIVYETAHFTLNMRGEVLDILGYLNTIVTDDAFRTAVVEPVRITIPERVSDEQKDKMGNDIWLDLEAKALSEISVDQIVNFTLDAVDEVIGDEFIDMLTTPDGATGGNGVLDALTIAQMAENIQQKIAGSIYLEQGYEGMLAEELAEFIAEQIANSVVNKVIGGVAEEISELIVERGEDGGYDYDDLVDLLGEDMANLLGEDIANGMTSNIFGLLRQYVSDLIEMKMINYADSHITADISQMVAEQVKEMEMPETNIDMTVYAYPGNGG